MTIQALLMEDYGTLVPSQSGSHWRARMSPHLQFVGWGRERMFKFTSLPALSRHFLRLGVSSVNRINRL
jgi:hypothetical protein